LKGTGKSVDEELLPDENEETFNEEHISQLTAFGFTRIQVENALAANGGDVNVAADWLLMHMDDPKINQPRPKKGGKSTSTSKPVNQDFLQNIMEMGFTQAQGTYALQKTDNNMERAVDFLFNNPGEVPEPQEPQEAPKESQLSDGSGEYKLFAFVNHIGSNVQSGHYICHIKKDGKWVKYNDEKVEESRNPPIQFGYLYFFERKN